MFLYIVGISDSSGISSYSIRHILNSKNTPHFFPNINSRILPYKISRILPSLHIWFKTSKTIVRITPYQHPTYIRFIEFWKTSISNWILKKYWVLVGKLKHLPLSFWNFLTKILAMYLTEMLRLFFVGFT